MCNGIDFIENITPTLLERVKQQMSICSQINRDIYAHQTDTPYTTIVHRDLWINNIMISRGD